MATLDELKLMLQQIKDSIDRQAVESETIAPSQVVTITGLSDLDDNLGLVRAGEFRAGKGTPGKGDFTGVRIGYPAFIYNDTEWHIVGVNSDTLQFGLRATDGVAVTAGGLITLGKSGIEIANNALQAGLRFLSSSDSVGAYISSNTANSLVLKLVTPNQHLQISNFSANDTQVGFIALFAGHDQATGAGWVVLPSAMTNTTGQGGIYRRSEGKLVFQSGGGVGKGGVITMTDANVWNSASDTVFSASSKSIYTASDST